MEISILIIKLLNLTCTNNDHECLLAIRNANLLLERNNLQWEDIIETKEKQEDNEKMGFTWK